MTLHWSEARTLRIIRAFFGFFGLAGIFGLWAGLANEYAILAGDPGLPGGAAPGWIVAGLAAILTMLAPAPSPEVLRVSSFGAILSSRPWRVRLTLGISVFVAVFAFVLALLAYWIPRIEAASGFTQTMTGAESVALVSAFLMMSHAFLYRFRGEPADSRLPSPLIGSDFMGVFLGIAVFGAVIYSFVTLSPFLGIPPSSLGGLLGFVVFLGGLAAISTYAAWEMTHAVKPRTTH